jgi:hypothetical protein
VSLLLLCSFAGGVEPFCLPSRSRPFVSFVCGLFLELVFGAPCVAYVQLSFVHFLHFAWHMLLDV